MRSIRKIVYTDADVSEENYIQSKIEEILGTESEEEYIPEIIDDKIDTPCKVVSTDFVDCLECKYCKDKVKYGGTGKFKKLAN